MIRERVIACGLLLSACADFSCSKPVGPIPTVQAEGLDDAVRQAIQKARDEAAAHPKDAQASGRLGMVLEAHTLYQPADLAFRRAIQLDPKEFSWRYYDAIALQFIPLPDEALKAIDAALALHPDYVPAVLRRADILFKLGRIEESGKAVAALAAETPVPHAAQTLYSLARAKSAQGDVKAAEDLYRRACEAYPEYGAARYGLAVAERSLGNQTEAERDFKQAEANKDRTPPAEDELLSKMLGLATGIETRLSEAKRAMKDGHYDQAAAIYREVLKNHPENPDALVNLLYLAQYPNEATPSEVESLYETARKVNPSVPQVYLYYGTALASEGKYEAAIAAIRQAIQVKPDFAEAHAWLADVWERQHRLNDAVTEYRAALAAQPSFRAAQMELGKILLEMGRDREAIPVLLPASQLEDDYTPVVMMFLGHAYLTTGDRENAVHYLQEARIRAAKKGPPALLAEIENGLRQAQSRP